MSKATTDPLQRSKQDPVVLGCVAFALISGAIALVIAVPEFRHARQVARDSAHSALWHEINQLLKAREATGDFPASLKGLPLTYPDNGSPELLELIDYRREEAGCRVSTTLRGEKFEQRYGPTQ